MPPRVTAARSPSRGWAVLVGLLAGCSAGEPAPPPAPEPVLEGPPIQVGIYTPEEARTTARLLTEAEGLLEGSRMDEALSLARQVEEDYPEAPGSSGALWVRARALFAQEDWTGAIQASEAYADILGQESPLYGDAYLLRAASRRNGILPGGIESLWEIPASSGERVLLGADSLSGVWASSLETPELRDLILEAPEHPRVFPVFSTELAVRRFLSGDEEEARAFAERALALDPGPDVANRALSVLDGRVDEELEVAAAVGGILPTSGSPSINSLAEELREGIEVALAVDEREYSTPILFLPLEDAVGPEDMTDAVRQLEDENVAGVLGPLQDATLEAFARSRSGLLPILSPTATLLPEGAAAVFTLNGIDPAEGEALADLAIGQGTDQVIVMHAASTETEEAFRWFQASFTSRGGSILRVLTYPPGTTGFAEHMREVLRIRPDGLVLIIPPEDVGLVAPQIAFYGVDTVPDLTIYGSASWTVDGVLDALQPQTVEGVYSVTSWVAEGEYGPGWSAFVDAYEDHFRRSLVSPTPALGYDAARMLLRAAREGGGSADGALGALERIQSFPGATGFLSVVDGRVRRTYVPVRIENRRPVLVTP